MRAPVTKEVDSSRQAHATGVILLLAAAVLWSFSGALIKLIFDSGQGPGGVTIAFYRSLFAGLFLLPLARGKFHTLWKRRTVEESKNQNQWKNRKSSSPDGQHSWFDFLTFGRLDFLRLPRPAAVACVVFFTLMTVCFVLANTRTEAANVIILQYTSTFWVFSLSPWVLRERPQTKDLWTLGLAMIGIGIIFVGSAATDLIGLVIALSSGLFFGLLTLMIRRMRDSDSAAVMVVNNLGSAALLLPAAYLLGDLMVSPRALLLLVIMGVVQFGLPYYLYTCALVRVPAYRAAMITLVEPILVPVWTYLAVGEKVPLMTAIGGGVVLIALALFLRAARNSRTRVPTEGAL